MCDYYIAVSPYSFTPDFTVSRVEVTFSLVLDDSTLDFNVVVTLPKSEFRISRVIRSFQGVHLGRVHSRKIPEQISIALRNGVNFEEPIELSEIPRQLRIHRSSSQALCLHVRCNSRDPLGKVCFTRFASSGP